VIVIYLLMALVGSAATLFAAQNIDPVVIRFLVWRVEGIPLALVILLSLLIGVIFASLSGAVRHWRLRSRVRQLENQVAQLAATQGGTSSTHSPQGPLPPA
jgi:uncharacterized integral membrane protein